MGITPSKYAEIVHCHTHTGHTHAGHAPAPAGRGRGSSQARTDGGRSGHTSRAASADGDKPRNGFQDAVRRRYKSACDYVRGNELFVAKYTRNILMAMAYKLEKDKNPALVVDVLQDNGTVDDKYTAEAMAMFGDRELALVYKKPTEFPAQKCRTIKKLFARD